MKSAVARLPILLVAVVGLFANQIRLGRYHETNNLNRVVGNADIPASVAITSMALGPLRSVVTNALWWRAIRQQDRGDFFDALQLADWITKLQPTYASVWAYLGWNMSYNIAHEFPRDDDRWQWIYRAIQLLRDSGLKYNPDDTIIKHELARIFYHRIGGKMDAGAEYFKNQWAFEMMKYFGASDEYEIERLSSAPATLAELREHPAVRDYYDEAQKLGFDVFDFDQNPPGAFLQQVDLPEAVKARAANEIFYHDRRARIERDLKLDMVKVQFVNTEYGPLDWRLHQAHAIYWSVTDDFEDFLKSGVNYSKIVRQSMVSSFHEGRLFHDPVRNTIMRTNNLKIVGKIHDFVEYSMKHEFSASVDNLHRQFLESAISILYSYNQIHMSRELFAHYAHDYLDKGGRDYDTFIAQNLTASLLANSVEIQGSVVESALYQSYIWLDLGEYDRSNGLFKLAALLWQRNQAKYQNRPAKLMPPLIEMAKSVRSRIASDRGISAADIEQKAKEARASKPREVYIGTYDDNDHAHH